MPSTTTPSVAAAVSLGAIVDVKDKNSLYAACHLLVEAVRGSNLHDDFGECRSTMKTMRSVTSASMCLGRTIGALEVKQGI